MTSGPTGIGGLYATVKLDTSQAIRELRRFDSQITRTAANLRKVRGTSLTKSTSAAGASAQKANAQWAKFSRTLGESAIYFAPGRTGSLLDGVNQLGVGLEIPGAGLIAKAGITGVGVAAAAAAVGVAAFGVGVFKLGKLGVDAGRELERSQMSARIVLPEGQDAERRDRVPHRTRQGVALPD